MVARRSFESQHQIAVSHRLSDNKEKHESYPSSGPQSAAWLWSPRWPRSSARLRSSPYPRRPTPPRFGGGHDQLTPGDLLVTTGVWTTNADITAGTTQLPPNCATANPAYVTCGTAVAPGTYPIVFNNDASDGSFGVTQPIVLDEVNPYNGRLVKAVTVPDNPAERRLPDDQLLVQVRACRQPVDRRPVRHLRRLRGPARHDRRLERQHPRRDRPDHRRLGHADLPRRGPGQRQMASSSSPRPTPSAATTAGPRSSTPRTAARAPSSRWATPATAPAPSHLP